MSASFNEQKNTTIGFAGYAQRDGHDDFSKLGSIMMAIGFDLSPTDLNQWGARVSRPFTKLNHGEVVPLAYEAYHFDSEFAKQVNGIDESTRSRSVKIDQYPVIKEALESLQAEHKLSANDMSNINIAVKKASCTPTRS